MNFPDLDPARMGQVNHIDRSVLAMTGGDAWKRADRTWRERADLLRAIAWRNCAGRGRLVGIYLSFKLCLLRGRMLYGAEGAGAVHR